MKSLWPIPVLLLCGCCSTHPAGDFLDCLQPGKLYSDKVTPYGGVCIPNQGVKMPVVLGQPTVIPGPAPMPSAPVIPGPVPFPEAGTPIPGGTQNIPPPPPPPPQPNFPRLYPPEVVE